MLSLLTSSVREVQTKSILWQFLCTQDNKSQGGKLSTASSTLSGNKNTPEGNSSSPGKKQGGDIVLFKNEPISQTFYVERTEKYLGLQPTTREK